MIQEKSSGGSKGGFGSRSELDFLFIVELLPLDFVWLRELGQHELQQGGIEEIVEHDVRIWLCASIGDTC